MNHKYNRRDFIKTTGIATASAVFMSGNETLAKPYLVALSSKKNNFPFIFGSQYYRAPTPEVACWEPDFGKMSHLGFTDVKFFVQWRWSHRTNDTYFFEDLDQLMNLAYSHQLRVTLNVLFDISPLWLFEKYPDAKQRMNNGQIVEPYVVSSRQIGGHPGPCYNHTGALEERKKFMRIWSIISRAIHLWRCGMFGMNLSCAIHNVHPILREWHVIVLIVNKNLLNG